MRLRAAVFGLFLLFTADASAQTCLGLPSFSEGPYQASVGLSFTDGAQAFNGGGAFGSENVFAGAGIQFVNFSDLDESAFSFGAHAGASFAVSQTERIEACPIAAISIATGPDVGDLDVNGIGLRAGGRLGMVAAETGNVEIVPTFGFDIAYARLQGELGDVETTLSRDTYVIVRAGVGFVLNKRMAVVPALDIPLGLDGSDPEFNVLFAINFGGR
jgi:hypothetical protein